MKWKNCRVIEYGDYRGDEQERRKWIEMRRGFIGGSDAGAFNPGSRYHSLFALYMDKVEGVSGFSGNASTERGSLIEEFIRKRIWTGSLPMSSNTKGRGLSEKREWKSNRLGTVSDFRILRNGKKFRMITIIRFNIKWLSAE